MSVLLSNTAIASSSSLKKLLTCPIPPPLSVLFDRSNLQHWRGCQRLKGNCKQATILNFTHYLLCTSCATLTWWSGPIKSTPQYSRLSGDCLPQTRLWSKNFVCTLFPTDHRNPFVSPLLGKFPYFFMTSKYWRYSCHISSFLTATSDN